MTVAPRRIGPGRLPGAFVDVELLAADIRLHDLLLLDDPLTDDELFPDDGALLDDHFFLHERNADLRVVDCGRTRLAGDGPPLDHDFLAPAGDRLADVLGLHVLGDANLALAHLALADAQFLLGPGQTSVALS